MRPKFLCIWTVNHPLKSAFKDKSSDILSWELRPSQVDLGLTDLTPQLSHYQQVPIFDLTILPSLQRDKLYQYFHEQKVQWVFSEGSCLWGDSWILRYPFVQGLFSSAFCGPKKAFEYYLRESLPQALKSAFLEFFYQCSYKGIPVSSPGIGHYFPRIISTIINEAYFALGEELAPKESMDQAMKLGVNYPLGPFEWASHIGEEKIVLLLDQLKEVTGETRYRAHPLLRLEAQKRWAEMGLMTS